MSGSREPLISDELTSKLLKSAGMAGPGGVDPRVDVRGQNGEVRAIPESELMIREIETLVLSAQAEFTDTEGRWAEVLRKTMSGCSELLLLIEGMPQGLDHLLLDTLQPDDRAALPRLLANWRRASQDTRSGLKHTGKIAIIETVGAVQVLTRRLLIVFDRYYKGRRLGRGATLRVDRINFISAGLRAIGVEDVPGPDRLERCYIQPARKSFNRLEEWTKRVAVEAPEV